MVVHQSQKAVKKFRLTVGRSGSRAVALGKALELVVDFEQDVLDPILDNRVAEDVLAVLISIGGNVEPDMDAVLVPVRVANRILAQEAEKAGSMRKLASAKMSRE